jgi:hypothetical protein
MHGLAQVFVGSFAGKKTGLFRFDFFEKMEFADF